MFHTHIDWNAIRNKVWERGPEGICQCAHSSHNHVTGQCPNTITKRGFKLVVQEDGQPISDLSVVNWGELWAVCDLCFRKTPVAYRVSYAPK